jgi:chain length determinant protein EpsF
MNFSALFAILRARMRLMLTVLGTTVVTALVVSFIMSPQYVSMTTLLIDAKSRDPVTGMSFPMAMLESYIATQVEIISSPFVARKVSDHLRLAEEPRWRRAFKEDTDGSADIHDWIADKLIGNLQVSPASKANSISIGYKASDPQEAANMANTFAQAYIDANMELRQDPAKRASEWYQNEIAQLRADLEKKQAILTNFQRERGLVFTEEKLDLETDRLNQLSNQLVSAQTQIFGDTARQNQQAQTSGEIMNNSIVQNLRMQLAKAEVDLAQADAQLGKNHPTRMKIKGDVDAIRTRLYAEMGNAGMVVAGGAAATKEREAALRAEVEKQKMLVLEIKSTRDELSLIIRDVEDAKRMYGNALERSGQARLESRNNQTEISILNIARPPLEPDSPNILLNTVLATFLGGMLAFGLVFLLETLDRRVRSPNDLNEIIGIPVLGVFAPVRPAIGRRRLALPNRVSPSH